MPLEPQWSTTASGRPSFDVWGAGDDLLVHVVLEAERELGFEVTMFPLPGLDMVIGALAKQGHKIFIGRDIWSGLFIYADTEGGDPYVRELAEWFERRLPIFETQLGSAR
jgi:hypothetical protein